MRMLFGAWRCSGVHVLFFLPSAHPCPFLKGNLSNSSKRSSNSKNLESYHDGQTWVYFHTWWLQWSLSGWSFICTRQYWVSRVFTASSISNGGHLQANFPLFKPVYLNCNIIFCNEMETAKINADLIHKLLSKITVTTFKKAFSWFVILNIELDF